MLSTQLARSYFVDRAATFVNEVEGVIRGYVCIWSGPDHRDAYGTYWDRERPAEIGMDFVPFPLNYEHAEDGYVQKDIIGKVLRIWPDDTGYAFEGTLDKSSPYFGRFISEIRAKELKTSSATAEHLAEFYPDGAFKNWMLVELTLTKSPAEYSMPAVSLIRSDNEQSRDAIGSNGTRLNQSEHGETRMFNTQQPPAPPRDDAPPGDPAAAGDAGAVIQQLVAQYGYDAVMAALQQIAPAQGEDPAAMSAPGQLPRSANFAKDLMAILESNKRTSETENLRKELADLKAARNAAPPPEDAHLRGGNGVNITVSEPVKYWGHSLPDLMFAHQVMKARGMRPSDDFMLTIAGRTAEALAKKEDVVYNPAVRSLLRGTRSDEIVTSSNTGNGDEWIGVGYSGTLWEKARNNRIFQELQSKGMRVEEVADGNESTVIFTEGADPTVYTITQSADLDATLRPTVVVPVTAPGTGQVTLTPGYLGMAIAYTSVFQEDSLIQGSSQFNSQMQEKAEETIEQLFLNGDITSSTANINKDGATDSTTSYYKASNGARYYALVTGSGTSRDGGALDENDFRLTMKLFPSAIRTRKKQMAFLIESDTHNTALGILALKTESERAQMATINSGVLENIWGVDVLESGFLPLADSDGKVTSAGNVVNTGTILGIYAPFWAMGWKRRVTIETQKDILSQSNLIVATFRLGFLPRGAGAAVETYNLTIA